MSILLCLLTSAIFCCIFAAAKLKMIRVMTRGKSICGVLKTIRKQVADANEIKYEPRVCHHKGECRGTCPACEAEVRTAKFTLSEGQGARRRQESGVRRQEAGVRRQETGVRRQETGVREFKESREFKGSSQEMLEENGDGSFEIMGDVDSRIIPEPPVVGEVPREDNCWDVVEQMPSFPGGTEALLEFLADNIQYPPKADEVCIQGPIPVTFRLQ